MTPVFISSVSGQAQEWLQQRSLAEASYHHVTVLIMIFFEFRRCIGKTTPNTSSIMSRRKWLAATNAIWAYISQVHCCMFAAQRLVGSWWIRTSFCWAHSLCFSCLCVALFCLSQSVSGFAEDKSAFHPRRFSHKTLSVWAKVSPEEVGLTVCPSADQTCCFFLWNIMWLKCPGFH